MTSDAPLLSTHASTESWGVGTTTGSPDGFHCSSHPRISSDRVSLDCSAHFTDFTGDGQRALW